MTAAVWPDDTDYMGFWLFDTPGWSPILGAMDSSPLSLGFKFATFYRYGTPFYYANFYSPQYPTAASLVASDLYFQVSGFKFYFRNAGYSG